MKKMDQVQIVLFLFAALVIVGSFVLAKEDQTATPIALIIAATLMALVAAVGPDSIISIQSGPEGFIFERIATDQEVADSLAIAIDTPELPPNQVRQVTEKAETRPQNQRTDADYLVLSMAAFRCGNQEEALKFAHAGLTLSSSSKRVEATLLLRVGYSYSELGLDERAIDLYHEAIATDKDFSWPHNNLGNIYDDRGETDSAIIEYKKSIELDPNRGAPHHNLGVIYARRGENDLAFTAFKNSIELDPDNARAHNNLGILYSSRGETDSAIIEYKKAIELDPNRAKPHNNLGFVYSGRGAIDAAITEYKKAIKLDPLTQHSYEYLAKIYRSQNQVELANEYSAKQVEADKARSNQTNERR